MRRSLMLILMLMLAIQTAQAWTFHGNAQRTGNFSDIAPMTDQLVYKVKIGGLVDSSPMVYDGNVYVISWYGQWYGESSHLACINATNGSVIWEIKAEGASTPCGYDGKVFVGLLNGSLMCVDANNGRIIWIEKLESNPQYWGIASSPLVYNDTLYVTTFSNGTLWALNLNGSVKWKVTTGGEISHYTSPSAYNGLIFFAGNESVNGTYVNELICANESGGIVWKFPVDSLILSSPAVGYGKVFFTTMHRIYAVNISTGKEVWNVSINGTISTPALAFGAVFVGSRDGKLYCIDANNGTILWTFQANGKIDSSPAVANGVIYFATNTPNGTIYALYPNGTLLWKYTLIPPEGKYYNIMSSPFVWNGKLFIGADDGNLYIFGIWKGDVTLAPGNFTVVADNGKTYVVPNMTALGALNEASKLGGFSYTVNETWGGGNLYPTSIGGIRGVWRYDVNGITQTTGTNKYNVSDGDTVVFWLLTKSGDNPKNAPNEVIIHVHAKKIVINNLRVSDGRRGGNATAYVNVTALKSGWFVIVVSGTNANGDSIAGISTVKLNFGETVNVPVIIPIPQLVQTGTYRLYAGVYELNNYPNELLTWFGSANCNVG